MPFINGQRVSNEEWSRIKSGDPVGWKEATGWKDGDDPVPEPEQTVEQVTEEAKPKRRGRKKAEAESALEAVTGLDIDLGDEVEE